jgi:hypothetical protein
MKPVPYNTLRRKRKPKEAHMNTGREWTPSE